MGDRTEIGGNLEPLKEAIKNGIEAMDAAILNRQAANEALANVRADLEAKGIPKKALAMALAYRKLDPEDRQGFDVAYDLVRQSIGLPVQGDLEVWAAKQLAKDTSGKNATVN